MIKLQLKNISKPICFVLGSHVAQCLPCTIQHLQIQIHNILVQRSIHTSKRNKVWEPNRRGTSEYDKEDTTSDMVHFQRGAKMLLPETKKWWQEMKDTWSQDPPQWMYPQEGVTDKYFTFNGPDSLEDWVVSADSDFDGGYSKANLSISPSGSGLFTGTLCTQNPKTGQIQNSGFVNLRFVPPMRSFYREPTYVFSAYTHLVLRIRGDGRNYMVNLHPHGMFDTSWLNLYSYVLHTRGGPYWQETKIPFSKFFMHYKGRIQDRQFPIDLYDIRNFSISLMDQNNGPFHLEVDYVGCLNDPNHQEEFAYEEYQVPKWITFN